MTLEEIIKGKFGEEAVAEVLKWMHGKTVVDKQKFVELLTEIKTRRDFELAHTKIDKEIGQPVSKDQKQFNAFLITITQKFEELTK